MTSSVWNRVRVFLRSLVHRARFETDMDDELRFHLQTHTERLMSQGLSLRDAARQARLEFGTAVTAKEGVRVTLGLRSLDDLRTDIRYAVRILRKSSGFTAIAISSLALAIGANTAIFSVANEMLYARLAVPHPRELRLIAAVSPSPSIIHGNWGSSSDLNGQEHHNSIAYPIYRQLLANNRSGLSLFAFKDLGRLNVTAKNQAQAATAQLVSGNFYVSMEITPELGRAILPTDDVVPGQGSVAVLSDGFWHRAFGASPVVLGRTLNVEGHLVTIVGVNPPGFTGAQKVQISPDLFLPLSMAREFAPVFRDDLIDSNTIWWVNIATRLPRGASQATAEAALTNTSQTAVRAFITPKAGEHIPTLIFEDGSRGLSYVWTPALPRQAHPRPACP